MNITYTHTCNHTHTTGCEEELGIYTHVTTPTCNHTHTTGCEDELGQMQNVRNQRLRLLQRFDRHTHDAVVWLENHRHLFNKHVFEPILLSVSPQQGFVG